MPSYTFTHHDFFFPVETELRTEDAWELYDSRLHDDAVLVFTTGQCHAFALALHELTDWKIVAAAHVVDEEYPDWDGPGIPDHFAVEHPDGRIVDVEGIWPRSRWMRKYGWDVKPWAPGDTYALASSDAKRSDGRPYLPAQVEEARPFARILLSLIEEEL